MRCSRASPRDPLRCDERLAICLEAGIPIARAEQLAEGDAAACAAGLRACICGHGPALVATPTKAPREPEQLGLLAAMGVTR